MPDGITCLQLDLGYLLEAEQGDNGVSFMRAPLLPLHTNALKPSYFSETSSDKNCDNVCAISPTVKSKVNAFANLLLVAKGSQPSFTPHENPMISALLSPCYRWYKSLTLRHWSPHLVSDPLPHSPSQQCNHCWSAPETPPAIWNAVHFSLGQSLHSGPGLGLTSSPG